MKISQRRVQNIYWTVSGNYERKYHGPESFYGIAERAFIDLVFPQNQLDNFARKNTAYLSNQEDLRKVIDISAKEWTKEALLSTRPGLKKFEKAFYQDILKREGARRNRSFSQELDYQYALFRLGRPMTSGPILGPLMDRIFHLKEFRDSKSFFQGLIDILFTFFKVNAEFVNEDIRVDIKDLPDLVKVEKKKKRKIVEKKVSREDFEAEEIGSAEFTNVKRDPYQGQESEEGLELLSTRGEEKILKRILMHYGGQNLPLGKQAELEKKLATGIHKGMKIHLTKGEFGKDINSIYFEEQILLQRQANIEAFKKDEHHYRRSIFELREILRKNLFDEFDQSQWKAKVGQIDPSQVWKYQVYGEEDIFIKKFFDNQGSFSVDILLDMSASQQDRQEEVSIQGYIITEALSSLGIPTRVLGFCNLFNYQILRIFRDYKDSKNQNEEIFSYKASGSNRDGFALRYVFETMNQNQAENQVLIVLSDGKPNDHLHIAGNRSQEVENYEDKLAVYDTAAEILQGRIKGKAILGVFTGLDEDLDQEKTIFGHDFVRITDLSRFSSIVGRYLRSVIERL